MSGPVIFKDLPATFPEKDKYQRPSLVSSLVFHIFLIATILLVPLMFSPRVEPWVSLILVAPLPPPPAAPPAAVEVIAAVAKPASPKVKINLTSDADALVSPIVVPKEIARIVEAPAEPVGAVGGVVGGIPGGVLGGVLGGILAASVRETEVAAPPPPPPPQPTPAAPQVAKEPVRVGGLVKEPKITKLVPPEYPILAQKAHVSGTVILEAVLTAEGKVEEIRVISGHPLLVEAAITCVKQWRYEPTYLNGEPVAVILTAKVAFYQKTTL